MNKSIYILIMIILKERPKLIFQKTCFYTKYFLENEIK